MKLFLSIMSAEENSGHSSSITLDRENGVLGRREGNTIVLPDPNNWISGQHAFIRYQGPDYYLIDNSTNGTLLNRSPLGKGSSKKLNDNDQFQIGHYVISVKLVEELPDRVDEPSPFPGLTEFAVSPAERAIEENALWKDPFEPLTQGKDLLDFSDLYPDEVKAKAGGIEIDEPLPQEIPLGPWPPEKPDRAPVRSSALDLTDGVGMAYDDKGKPSGAASLAGMPDLPFSSESVKESRGVSGSQDELIKSFLRGAELENSRLAEALGAQSFYIVGRMLRASVQGTQDVLNGRAKIKNEMHLDLTMIKSAQNNPIRFSVSADEALLKLLGGQDKGYLKPEEAIRDAFDDIRAHQYAVIAGMRAALLALLKRFDPVQLERSLPGWSSSGSRIPVIRQAKLWKSFDRFYREIESEAKDNFYHLFGRAFAETYEQEEKKIKKARGGPD